MFSSMQLLSFLSIILVIVTINYTHAVPINSIDSEENNMSLDEQTNYIDDESNLYKRKLPVEGILIGRRSFPNQGFMLGRRDYPTEGVLIGKREHPTQGIMLGRRNLRFFAPKATA